MIADKSPNYISQEDYLAQEEDSPIKHEYSDGEIYAMAGASDAHVTIALNRLRGSCREQRIWEQGTVDKN
uniref:Uncharacterized protein n=1 Tax=Moorena producens (strain JHB) TaxID=1454205 RepID=A0A1D9G364_MOOP1